MGFWWFDGGQWLRWIYFVLIVTGWFCCFVLLASWLFCCWMLFVFLGVLLVCLASVGLWISCVGYFGFGAFCVASGFVFSTLCCLIWIAFELVYLLSLLFGLFSLLCECLLFGFVALVCCCDADVCLFCSLVAFYVLYLGCCLVVLFTVCLLFGIYCLLDFWLCL